MELRVLKYFLAVAREENITSAAQQLHVTQPTLSKQLMELEEELGKTLFIRGKRKITLTEEGLFLRKRAQEIIELTDKTEAAFKTGDDVISGDIYFGCGETVGMHYIAKAIKILQEKHPNIKFHIFSGDGSDVTEKLDKGLVDFGLFVGLIDLKKYNHIELPISDKWGLLIRKDHPLANQKTIAPNDLENIPVMYSRQTLAHNEFAGWLGYSPEELNIVGTHTLVNNAAIMVEEGIGCSLTIDGLINTEGGSPLCFRPFDPKITARLVVAWKKYQVFSKAAEKFLEIMRVEVGKPIKNK